MHHHSDGKSLAPRVLGPVEKGFSGKLMLERSFECYQADWQGDRDSRESKGEKRLEPRGTEGWV